MLAIAEILLLILGIILLFLLFRKLLIWWSRFKRWQNEKIKSQGNANNEIRSNIIGKKAPKINAIELSNDKSINLTEITKGQTTILVFLSAECAFCSNNFEEFLNMIQDFSNINCAIILKHEHKEKAMEYEELFNESFDIYLVNDTVFQNYQIPFFPDFVLIDDNQIIKGMTPSPLELFRRILPA